MASRKRLRQASRLFQSSSPPPQTCLEHDEIWPPNLWPISQTYIQPLDRWRQRRPSSGRKPSRAYNERAADTKRCCYRPTLLP